MDGAEAPPASSGASTTTAMASSWTITERNATIWTGPTRANQAQFKALMDELEGKFNYAPGPMDSQEVDVFDIGITVADVQGKTYWAAYIMRTPENPTNDE